MNNYFKLCAVLFLFSALLCSSASAQTLGKKAIWQKNQLIEPATLAATLKNPTAKKPPIYNIGFVSDIPGSKNLGAARDEKGLENLKQEVKTIPKNSLVVIYCGCCPFEKCPNVLPAYRLLTNLGFANTKILNLPTSLKADWIDKGYPMAKK